MYRLRYSTNNNSAFGHLVCQPITSYKCGQIGPTDLMYELIFCLRSKASAVIESLHLPKLHLRINSGPDLGHICQ